MTITRETPVNEQVTRAAVNRRRVPAMAYLRAHPDNVCREPAAGQRRGLLARHADEPEAA